MKGLPLNTKNLPELVSNVNAKDLGGMMNKFATETVTSVQRVNLSLMIISINHSAT